MLQKHVGRDCVYGESFIRCGIMSKNASTSEERLGFWQTHLAFGWSNSGIVITLL